MKNKGWATRPNDHVFWFDTHSVLDRIMGLVAAYEEISNERSFALKMNERSQSLHRR